MQPSKAHHIMRSLSSESGRADTFIHESTATGRYAHTGFGDPVSVSPETPPWSVESTPGDDIEITTWRKPTLRERFGKVDPLDEIAALSRTLHGLGYLAAESQFATDAASRPRDPEAPELIARNGNSDYNRAMGMVVSTIYLRDRNPQR